MTGIRALLITLLLLGSAWGQSLQQTTQWMGTFASAHSLWHGAFCFGAVVLINSTMWKPHHFVSTGPNSWFWPESESIAH